MTSICHQQEIFPLGEMQKPMKVTLSFIRIYGWHLDRAKFDLMLLNAAKKEDVLYLETKIENVDNNFAES